MHLDLDLASSLFWRSKSLLSKTILAILRGPGSMLLLKDRRSGENSAAAHSLARHLWLGRAVLALAVYGLFKNMDLHVRCQFIRDAERR
jgi:hypothetical protein